MKVVLFGDSLLAQCGKHRVKLLESVLGEGADVYNCAAGGWDTNDLVQKADYIASLNPDLLVLSVGTNDAAPWKRVDLELFKRNLTLIMQKLKDIKVIYMLPPPVNESAARETGKEIAILDIRPYYDAAREFCNQESIGCLDAWDAVLLQMQSKDDFHIDDGVHLTDAAYEYIFNEAKKVIA